MKKTKFNMDYHLKTHLPFVLKHWTQYGIQPHRVVQIRHSDDAALEESGGLCKALASEERKSTFNDMTNVRE